MNVSVKIVQAREIVRTFRLKLKGIFCIEFKMTSLNWKIMGKVKYKKAAQILWGNQLMALRVWKVSFEQFLSAFQKLRSSSIRRRVRARCGKHVPPRTYNWTPLSIKLDSLHTISERCFALVGLGYMGLNSRFMELLHPWILGQSHLFRGEKWR